MAAAQLLQIKQVPCIRVANLTALQKRAYIIADNKLALNAGRDEDLLAHELGELLTVDENFEVGVTGFTIAESAAQGQNQTFGERTPISTSVSWRTRLIQDFGGPHDMFLDVVTQAWRFEIEISS